LREENFPAPHWQQGFFDHLLRSAESYSGKWEYVFQNPVRAGLVRSADEWEFSGEVVATAF
jgi:putative transposase